MRMRCTRSPDRCGFPSSSEKPTVRIVGCDEPEAPRDLLFPSVGWGRLPGPVQPVWVDLHLGSPTSGLAPSGPFVRPRRGAAGAAASRPFSCPPSGQFQRHSNTESSDLMLRDFILTSGPGARRSCGSRPDGSTECPSLRGDGVLIGYVSPSPPGTSQMARGFIPPLATGTGIWRGAFSRPGQVGGLWRDLSVIRHWYPLDLVLPYC
jgi:hypothetical protein